jgi:hypothetical protein
MYVTQAGVGSRCLTDGSRQTRGGDRLQRCRLKPASDQSLVNAAITALVLPGAFGPYQTGLAIRLAI